MTRANGPQAQGLQRPAAVFGLDTRRAEFHAEADLTGSAEFIDLLRFEATEAMASACRVGLICHAAALQAGVDIGWRAPDGLVGEMSAAFGDELTLAVSSDGLRRVLFERGAGGTIGVPFSTTVAFARGVQASPQRQLTISPRVRAPAPAVAVRPRQIDVSRPAGLRGHDLGVHDLGVHELGVHDLGVHDLGVLEVSLPVDLALETDPVILIELASEDLGPAAAALALELPALGGLAVHLSRLAAGGDGRVSRWRIGFDDARLAAGQVLRLELAVGAQALIEAVDRQVAAGRERLALSVAARLTGWSDQGSGGQSLWRVNAPIFVSDVLEGSVGGVQVSLAGAALVWSVAAGGEQELRTPPVEASFDLDNPRRSLRLPELALRLAGWPLTLSPRLKADTMLGGPQGATAPVSETIELATMPGDLRRGGVHLLPIPLLIPGLVAAIEREIAGRAEWRGELVVALQASGAADGMAAARLRLVAPIVARPLPRRFPLVIDCGATGVTIWAGGGDVAGGGPALRRLGVGADGAILPGVLAEAAMGALAHLAPPPLRGAPDLPRFHRDAPSPALAASGRRRSPKQAMVGKAMARQAAGETRRPPELMADALAGLVVGEVLPRLAELRKADDARTRLAPRIILCAPCGVGAEPDPVWSGVANRLSARLAPYFPGCEALADTVTLVSEAVAAGRQAAARLGMAGAASADQVRRVLCLDVGATTTQLCVADHGPERAVSLVAFGAEIAGDDLHDALLGVVAGWVDALCVTLGERFRPLHGDLALAATGSIEPSSEGAGARSAALDVLSAAVAEARIALGDAWLRMGSKTWRGDGAPPFAVTLARFGGAEPPRGVLLPLGAVEPGGGEIEDGVGWRITRPGVDGRQSLVLSAAPSAFAGEVGPRARLAAVVSVLAEALPRMAMSAVPARHGRTPRDVVLSGRGALWPPLVEALRAEAERFGDRLAALPTDANAMKHAVAAGAALLAAEGMHASAAPAYGAMMALAVQGVTATAAGETAFTVERLHYLAADASGGARAYEADNPDQPSLVGRINLGRRFALVRALPGLDPSGRRAALWRLASDGSEPLRPLEGASVIDAQGEGVGYFGPCDIEATPKADGSLSVMIRALDTAWSATFTINAGVVERDGGRLNGEGV
jgi:hypothetical protein